MHTLCAAFRRLFRYFSPQACIKSGIIHYLCNATAPPHAGSGHTPDSRTGRTAARRHTKNHNDSQEMKTENVHLTYFSATYTTRKVARAVAEQTLNADPAWNSLRAVQEGRCYVMDQTLYNLKPNARWGQAYEQLADILYPAA